jgi:hypothetical protein
VVWEENVEHIVSLVARDGNSTEKYIPREHKKKNGVSKHFRYAGLRQDLVEPNFCLDQTRSNQIKYEAQSVKCHFYSCFFQVDHIVLPYRGEDALEFVPTLRKMSKYPLRTHSPIFPEKISFLLFFLSNILPQIVNFVLSLAFVNFRVILL